MSTIIKTLLLASAVIAGFFANDLITFFQAPAKVSIEEYCHLSTTTCEQDGVAVTLSQDTVQPLQPSTIKVKWTGSQSESLVLELQGYEMNMGTARFTVARTSNGDYQADILLPACTIEGMTWIGTVSDNKDSIDVAIRMAR